MTIRVISFDLDDTLVRTAATIPARVRHAVSRACVLLDRPYSDGLVSEAMSRVLGGHPDLRPANLLASLGVGPDEQHADAIVAAYGERTLELLDSVSGARDLLQSLRGRFTTIVLTNGQEELQRAKLRTVGLGHLVDAVFTSEACGARKPDPAIFSHVAAAYGLRPNEILHVGDSLETDIYGAYAAGWTTVWLRPSAAQEQRTEHNPPTFGIETLDTLHALLPLME